MPNKDSGFTGNEIAARVINFVGNTSDSFQTYVEQSLPLAESRFNSSHDWRHLWRNGLSLAVTNGTAEYELKESTIGVDMNANDVETIYDEDNGLVLKRIDLNQMRRFDPQTDDGTAEDHPQMWAPVSDNKVRFWPPTFESGTLKIDGRIGGSNLWNASGLSLTTYPRIPPEYQEGFIQYVIAMALQRENDDRYISTKQEAMQLIKESIRDDMRNTGNTENARFRSLREAKLDGIGANLEALFVGWYDPYYDYWI